MSLLRRPREEAVAQPLGDTANGTTVVRTIEAKIHTVGCSGLRTVSVRGFRLSSGDGAEVAGFDLGPSPEEHLLAALGSSLGQAISNVACSRDLSIDRVDIELVAELVVDPLAGNPAGIIRSVHGAVVIASEDPAGHFAGLEDDALTLAPLVHAVTFPVSMRVAVVGIDPATQHSDWQI